MLRNSRNALTTRPSCQNSANLEAQLYYQLCNLQSHLAQLLQSMHMVCPYICAYQMKSGCCRVTWQSTRCQTMITWKMPRNRWLPEVASCFIYWHAVLPRYLKCGYLFGCSGEHFLVRNSFFLADVSNCRVIWQEPWHQALPSVRDSSQPRAS